MKQILRIATVCLGFLLWYHGPALAQNPEIVITDQSPAAEMGTFQFIRTGKQQEAIQMDLLKMIEAKRHDTEVTYYMIGENTLVKILPKSEINKPDFKPLKDLYMDEKSLEGLEK